MLQRAANIAWWLGLSIYLGGMLALGAIAAPAIFHTVRQTGTTLPGLMPWMNAKEQLGGEIFGQVLQRFAWVEWVCLGLMLAGSVVAFRKAQPRASVWIKGGLLFILILLTMYDLQSLNPLIWRVRKEWRAANTQQLADPLAKEFNDLHKTAERVAQAKAYALLGLLLSSAWTSADLRPSAKPNEIERGNSHA